MLAGLAFGSEIKRFGRSRMTRLAIVVLMLLPLVYGALYLWAFWNPFGEVNKMPVALVNSDRGAVVSGQQINAGDQITKSLTADASLKVRKGNYQRIFDEGRRRVRAWEQANVR